VNAWSEIAATITPAIAYAGISIVNAVSPSPVIVFPESMFIIVGITTIVWIITTFLTRPTTVTVIDAFYRRVRPTGFWGNVVHRHPDIVQEGHFTERISGWLLGVLLIYSVLFLLGSVFFGSGTDILLWAAVALTSAVLLWRLLLRLERKTGHDTII
jgi:hypothetical protein